jgi:hypothetical protein
MNSTPPLAKDWATVGRVIYSASSAEEKEVANDLLDSLFEGNTEERDNFVKRFFGDKHLTGQRQLQTNTEEHQITGSEGKFDQIT